MKSLTYNVPVLRLVRHSAFDDGGSLGVGGSRFTLTTLAICYFLFAIAPASGTTVFGNLSDISIQALNTKLMFAPTNEVMLAQSGLSAGPPKIITTVNGAFSLP